MAIKSNFDEGRFNKEFKTQVEDLYQKIIESFIRAGEEFIINARNQIQDHAMGTYQDRTGNLRNSIGYFVFHDGELVKEVSNIVTNKEKIQPYIKTKGVQLIGIAGMNYASYVESKGYNVISYQADVCVVDLAMYLETLGTIKQGTAAKIEESFIPE